MEDNKTAQVFIGLGSNLGDKEGNIKSAIDRIIGLYETSLIKSSSLYRTSPVGNVDQDWFVNAVISLETMLPPKRLLTSLLDIENSLGRVRRKKWGERTIDIDILLYDDIILSNGDLIIPHPHLHERRFVLQPLFEIAPGLLHPLLKESISGLLHGLDTDEEVEKI